MNTYDATRIERFRSKVGAVRFARPVVRKVADWAEQVRVIPVGGSVISDGRPIPYRHAVMPHLVEPMDACDDPKVKRIVMWMGIRDGKTLGLCANVIGRTVTDKPGNIYSVHPTSPDGAKFSNDDIEPMIEACLSDYFVERKSRDAGRTITYKRFRGGSMRIFSAGQLTAFRGTSVSVLLLHELDALDSESIYKAFGRTTGFADAIIIEEGTCTDGPTLDADGKKVYHSNIQRAYEEGDQRKWFCACRSCGHLQTLKYSQIRKLEKKRGEVHFYLCEKCGADHNEKQWRKMAGSGIWYPTAGLTVEQLLNIEHTHVEAVAPDPTVRSYWRNGFNTMLPTGKGYKTKLDEFVGVHDSMCKTPEGRKTWTNEIAAEVWSERDENAEDPPQWKAIYDARENYEKIPAGGLIVTAFVDVQANRLELLRRAWGRGGESWGMLYEVIDGDFRSRDTWLELGRRLRRKLPHESGASLGLSMCFIDGGKWSEWVGAMWLADVYRLPENQSLVGKVRVSKGVGAPNTRIIARPWATIGNGVKGVHIGTWEAKDTIYQCLREGAESEAPMHYNMSFDERFFEMLTAEEMVPKYVKGVMVRTYDNPQSKRNEALDLEVGCLAAFKMRKWDFQSVEERLAEEKENAKPAEVKPARVIAQPVRRIGTMGGWRV